MQGWRKTMEDACLTEVLEKTKSGKYLCLFIGDGYANFRNLPKIAHDGL